jgi:hypothetical protein
MTNELNRLRDTLDKCETLHDALSCYTGSKDIYDIIDDLKCSDTLWAMSEQNDTSENDLEDWVHGHWDSFVSCKIFQECGPAGGWPVVEIKCLDKVFYFDWVTE